MTTEIRNFIVEKATWAHESIQNIPVAGDVYNWMGAYVVTPAWDGSSYLVNTYVAPFFRDVVVPQAKKHNYIVGGAGVIVGLFVIRALANEYIRRHPTK